jgi:hypothetical protein
MVMPGDTTDMKVELIQPIAMEEGQSFAIREGGRTVGAGTDTPGLRQIPGCGTLSKVQYAPFVALTAR